MYWLGIDVGTGGTRALLIDADGAVVEAFTAAHAGIDMPRPLWAEQDPADWWRASVDAVRGVLAKAGARGGEVAGIGFSGQMHGLVVLDSAGRVIRPALIWCDQRSAAEVESINRIVGPEDVVGWTANPPNTGFTLPKLLWVREHEPNAFARVRRVLLPKDYVRFRLSGDIVTDVSDASGTGLFDVAHRRWSQEMLDGLGLDRAVLPSVVESDRITGQVSAEGAALTGLAEGTPMVGGAGDQAASAIGNGIVEPGVASCTLGTSGVVFAHLDSPACDTAGRVHTFCHAVPHQWHVMGVTQGAGLSLQWVRRTLFPEASYDELMDIARQAAPCSEGLYWLPYLMGERAPHLDASARGGWVGLTARHTRSDLVRSVVEGVCYSQKDCLEIITGMDVAVSSVRMSGGGARSPFWRQVLADVLGKRVATLASQEGSAYGAALLALAGTSDAGSVAALSLRLAKELSVSEPDPATESVYRTGHRTYRSLYPSLRSFFAAGASGGTDLGSGGEGSPDAGNGSHPSGIF
jgi:xylulokinase